MSRLELWGVEGIGEIALGARLADVIVDACRHAPNGP